MFPNLRAGKSGEASFAKGGVGVDATAFAALVT